MIFRLLRNYLWQRRRKIFRFRDGKSVRGADPIVVALALHRHKEYLPEHLVDAANGVQEARESVAAAACDVFSVTPLADNGKHGLTVAERIELMMAFDAYLHALKKNTKHSPTPQTSSDATSQSSSEPTTNDSSASG